MSSREEAAQAIEFLGKWSLEGFPGANLTILTELIKLMEDFEERESRARREAGYRCELALSFNAFEVRDELQAAGIPLKYRRGIYMERMGVKRGNYCFNWMENSQ